MNVQPGGAADKAGLRPTRKDRKGQFLMGDLIVAVGGKPIRTNKDLYLVLDQYQVGDTVVVSVVREDERIDVQLTLVAVPP